MTESDRHASSLRLPSRAASPAAGELRVLCAGAAQGLLTRLAPQLPGRCGAEVAMRFGAVGALRDALLGGEVCDVLIVTDAMVAELGAAGHVALESRAALGQVGTGIAVRRGDDLPNVSDAAQLARALRAARAIHLPDPTRATAGIHFTAVIRRLGLFDELADRLCSHPNGASAMRALAESSGPGQIGCTQMSEIMFAHGVQLVAGLPRGLELNTTYTAVATAASRYPVAAHALVACLGAPELAELRAECGIEPAARS